jgi:hypothetical protein
MELNLINAAATGVEVETGCEGVPNGAGVLCQYSFQLPEWDRACYFAPYQAYDHAKPNAEVWVEGANRCQPLVVEDLTSVRSGGLFLLLRLKGGGYLALLPMAGPRTFAWFSSDLGLLTLNLGTLGTAWVTGEFPVLAWARADDAYCACHEVWETALAYLGWPTRLRSEKPYPEIFRYLGWCSWEEYRRDIGTDLLLDALEALERSELPVRYMLIDDGHLDHHDRQLVSFEPNEKFPKGWASLLDRRTADGIRWMGLWLNFNGYWDGVNPLNNLGDLNEHLGPDAAGQRLLPGLGFLHSVAFYDAMIGAAREAGFDFVKVDNQAGNLWKYRETDQPVVAATENAQSLEVACARHMDGLINCMAHNGVCAFNTRISAVTRCSEDYRLGDLARARRHLYNSYGNLAWLGPTVWGDHDMFHSNDPVSGRMMAVSKAVSGGPVYLSDAPNAFAGDDVRPLCLEDGRLLRPLAPAAPLPDSLFVDPYAEGQSFQVIAPLANGAAALVAYNLTEPEVAVTLTVEPTVYTHAGQMQQPPQRWALPKEGLVVYDWYDRKVALLDEPWTLRLNDFDDRLLLLCPIEAGWSVIGRQDKFLAPAAVEVLRVEPERMLLRMHETGPLAIWRLEGGVESACVDFESRGDGLWVAEMAVGERDRILEIVAGS